MKRNFPVLKMVKASVVFIDPPFGWHVDEWDEPEEVWQPDYWFDVLESILGSLMESAAIVVFGDCFNVLPLLLKGVA